jgi:hypothetical protein
LPQEPAHHLAERNADGIPGRLRVGRARDEQPGPGHRAEQQAGQHSRVFDPKQAGRIGCLQCLHRGLERVALIQLDEPR